MKPITAAAVQDFLNATVPAFERKEKRLRDENKYLNPSHLDITSYCNTVTTYQDADSQFIYANMYFAKHIGCWRWLRRRSKLSYDAVIPVVSIGAGPLFCLWGWFFDYPPFVGQTVHAFDVLPWDAVLGLPEHATVTKRILRDPKIVEVKQAFIPPGVVPRQMQHLENVKALCPEEVPENAMVLLPFLLNHLIGRNLPLFDEKPLVEWLEAVRARATAIIVVDLPASRATNFWPGLLQQLKCPAGTSPKTFTFSEETSLFGDLYPDRWDWRKRRTHQNMTSASGIVGTKNGWYPIDPAWPVVK